MSDMWECSTCGGKHLNGVDHCPLSPLPQRPIGKTN